MSLTLIWLTLTTNYLINNVLDHVIQDSAIILFKHLDHDQVVNNHPLNIPNLSYTKSKFIKNNIYEFIWFDLDLYKYIKIKFSLQVTSFTAPNSPNS